MRIAAVDVLLSSPGRAFVTLKITTDDGLVGWGDGTVNGREPAVAAYLQTLAPLLIGRDASRIEDTWQYLYRGAYWRRGPITMAAISAVDQCLWDIAGKAAGLPVHKLLGGASRDWLMTYRHASGLTIDEVVQSVADHLEQGYSAIRIQGFIPGLRNTYGTAAKKEGVPEGDEAEQPTGPGGVGLPEVETWDTQLYLDFVPRMVKAVRDELGYGFHLLHDSHHRLTPNEAAWLGQRLEPYRMFWLEDVTPAEDQAAFRLIRSRTTTPLAVGEVFNSWHDYSTLVTERLIDYVRSPVTHAGGITHLRQILGVADLYGIRSACHGPSDISPIGMAASCQLGQAIHNFGIQEFMGYPDETMQVFTPHFTLADGVLTLDDTPGLGCDYDESAAEKFEFVEQYLPVNRLLDGSVHDW